MHGEGGMCGQGGVHGEGGMCSKGWHTWQKEGRALQRGCVVKGGLAGGHAWQGGMHAGQTATEGGTHSTGMHPRCGLFLQLTETEFHNQGPA